MVQALREKHEILILEFLKEEGLSYKSTQDVWPELGKIHNLPVGLTGEGIKIAVLDTAIFRGHTAFADKCCQLRYFNFIKDSTGQPLSSETAYRQSLYSHCRPHFSSSSKGYHLHHARGH